MDKFHYTPLIPGVSCFSECHTIGSFLPPVVSFFKYKEMSSLGKISNYYSQVLRYENINLNAKDICTKDVV